MRAVWPNIFDAMVERMLTLALVMEVLSGKSFLNLSRASIFLAGSVMRLASWYAFASGDVYRPEPCAAVAGVAGLAWSAGGAALSGSMVCAFAAEMASASSIAEKTVRSFICRISKFRFPWFGSRLARTWRHKDTRLSIFYTGRAMRCLWRRFCLKAIEIAIIRLRSPIILGIWTHEYPPSNRGLRKHCPGPATNLGTGNRPERALPEERNAAAGGAGPVGGPRVV